ncbi:glycosyltransferase [Flavobacterium sp.]|uniref:glycosyltransferase n=1 Tax=Flavobacterium sp. TaxID=239 RepID=UPI003752164C
MENSLVSIIVPVYNVENYLEHCITSLLNQTYKNCEFIFVNDGSIDSSLSIIEKFQAIDSRIKLINQENKGVSVARNNGLEIAKGKYIGFVDADDWVKTDMYETLVNAIEKFQSDIVLFNMIRDYNSVEFVANYDFPDNQLLDSSFIQNQLFSHLIKKDDLYSSCNKLFKASIIKDNIIKFPAGDELSEDNIFNLLYFDKIKTFLYLDYAAYYYREVEGSATRNIKTKDYFKNILRIYNFNYKSYMTLKFSDEALNELKSEKLITGVLSLIHLYFSSNQLPFFQRYKYVKNMVYNETLQEIITKYESKLMSDANRFNGFLLQSIKQKSVLKLYLAVLYSRFRNR